MTIDVTLETTIARPSDEVAAYMFDPANDLGWPTGIVASHPEQPGRLEVGHRVVRTAKFLGRTFDYLFEVIDAGDGFVHMKVDKPFPMQIRYELAECGRRNDGPDPHVGRARRLLQAGGAGDDTIGAPEHRERSGAAQAAS